MVTVGHLASSPFMAVAVVVEILNWVIVSTIQLQVDMIHARHAEHGVPKHLIIEVAWGGCFVNVWTVQFVLTGLYFSIALLDVILVFHHILTFVAV